MPFISAECNCKYEPKILLLKAFYRLFGVSFGVADPQFALLRWAIDLSDPQFGHYVSLIEVLEVAIEVLEVAIGVLEVQFSHYVRQIGILLSLFNKLEGTAATRQFNSMKDDIHNDYVRGTEMQRDIFQEQHRGKPL